MSDKTAVLQAMKKMKKSNFKTEETSSAKTSGNKSFKDEGGKENISSNIINAVSNLKRKD